MRRGKAGGSRQGREGAELASMEYRKESW